MVTWLRELRPSNLILLVASPFLIYLFASDADYARSLAFIVGVEERAGPVFVSFLLVMAALGTGLATSILLLRQSDRNRLIMILAGGHLMLLAYLALIHDQHAFYHSVIGSILDIRTSPWMVSTERIPTLTADALSWLDQVSIVSTLGYAALFGWFVLLPLAKGQWPLRPATAIVATLMATKIAVLLLFAHLSFATGLFVTLRAAVIAYIAAAILGLGLAGLLGLRARNRTVIKYSIVVALMALTSAYLLTRPLVGYALVGELSGRVAIIQGTPGRLSDTIKTGSWPGGPEDRVSIRAAEGREAAVRLLVEDERITAAFLPTNDLSTNMPVIWEVQALPDHFRTPGIALAVLSAMLAVFTFSAWQRYKHPLAVFAEFFIDTIRGIPMLVIILYIGLPLSGAVKDATGGFFDLPNMVRGMIAIAIGYSAYMAEIFRAGIEAIPRGQLEAAGTIGLSRWHTARYVVLPQAIRIVIPPLGNEFIAMLKDTSLLSILSVRDVTQRTREFQAASFLPFAPFNTAAILYVVLTLIAASGLKWVERRTGPRVR